MAKVTAVRNELDSRLQGIETLIHEDHESYDDDRDYAKTVVANIVGRIAITRLTDEQLREVLGLSMKQYLNDLELYEVD